MALELILDDDFTRADSSTLGAPWTTQIGDWGILSNKARSTTNSGSTFGTAQATIPLPGVHRRLTWEWSTIARGPCEHLVRYRSTQSGLFISGSNSSNSIFVFERVGFGIGNENVLASTNPGSWGTSPTIEAEDDGSTLLVSLNGSLVLTVDVSAVRSGRACGLSGQTFTATPHLTTARLARFEVWCEPIRSGFRLGHQRFGIDNGGF